MCIDVSIIIPYVKDRGYLDQAIESVYNQTFKGGIELIESKSNKSVGYNLNRGIEISKGKYIKYLCDDDLLTYNSIQDSVDAMNDNDFIHGNSLAIDSFGNDLMFHRHVGSGSVDVKSMLVSNKIHGGTLMYRRDVFDRFGLFDESLTTGEEYEFNLRLLSLGAKLGHCNRWLYKYRRHHEQKSLGVNANQLERIKIINEIKQRYK